MESKASVEIAKPEIVQAHIDHLLREVKKYRSLLRLSIETHGRPKAPEVPAVVG